MKTIPLLLATLLILCGTLLPAQDAAELVPQTVAVQLDANSDTQYLADMEQLAAFLRLELIHLTRTTPAAVASAADVLVSLAASGSTEGFMLTIRAASPTETHDGKQWSHQSASLEPGAVLDFLRETARRIDSAFPPQPPKIIEVVTERIVQETETVTIVRGTRLVLLAAPGMRIQPDGQARQEVPESGRLEFELSANTTFSFSASRSGYHPLQKTLFVGSEDFEETIELETLPRLEIVGTLRHLNIVPAIGANWYWVPGYAWLGGMLETSLLSWDYFEGKNEDPSKRLRYAELQLHTGLRLGAVDAKLRFALNAGIAGRLEIAEQLVRPADWAAFSSFAGIEASYRLTRSISLYTGSQLRLLLYNDPYGLMDDYQYQLFDQVENALPLMTDLPPGWKVGEKWFLQLPEVLVGLRIEL
ncbi:MAG: hypothetical protein KKI09_04480 [Spirochaetes bacterium]|nr:hypothetical protein [Spirochaetota bacterium]MBU0954667.1 hypothetical protein [Spirochaetota bacterium]